jgi:hypothetical protein
MDAARDADGQRRDDPGGWADVVRVVVLWLPDEYLQLLQASRAELGEYFFRDVDAEWAYLSSGLAGATHDDLPLAQ